MQWAHSTHSGICWKSFVLFSFPKLFIYTIPFNSSVWFPLKQRFILFYFMLFHFRCLCVCAFLSFSLFYFTLIEISFVSDYFQSFSRSFIRFVDFILLIVLCLHIYLLFDYNIHMWKQKKNKILWKLLLIVFNISFLKRYTNIAHAANGRAIATNRPFSSFKYACCRWIWYKFVCVFIVHHFVGSVFHDMAHSQFIL